MTKIDPIICLQVISSGLVPNDSLKLKECKLCRMLYRVIRQRHQLLGQGVFTPLQH